LSGDNWEAGKNMNGETHPVGVAGRHVQTLWAGRFSLQHFMKTSASDHLLKLPSVAKRIRQGPRFCLSSHNDEQIIKVIDRSRRPSFQA